MFRCTRCDAEFRDGAECSVCRGQFDFPCAGITEQGYRLGERKNAWKCTSCKGLKAPKSPTPVDMDSVLAELKSLSLTVAILPTLDESIKSMKAELSELVLIKPELAEIKSSIDFVDRRLVGLSDKIVEMDKEIQSLKKAKQDIDHLQLRVYNLEAQVKENDQRSRLNNVEIKGVPITSSENLFDVVNKIGSHINCTIPKEQINYIARVPMRNDKNNKSIVVAFHSRYIKDDFVAAAKKYTTLAGDLGLLGDSRIYVNDHLSLENKILLSKTKALAKEKGFAFTWVKGCKIFVRKNAGSPLINIRSELDLKKL